MGQYIIDYTETAINDLRILKKSGNRVALKKIDKLISELKNHPFEGTGQPEPLKHELDGFWSRRINKKDRLIYKVEEHIVTVIIVSALGHYLNK
jgi:toxin YoeB